MRYTVYKTTNLINGRFYVGVHKTENPNDSYIGSGDLLRAAVRKYGRANFKKEVLHEFDTPQEMEAKEVEIVTREFVDREETYNLVPGGFQGDAFYQAMKRIPPEVRRANSAKGGRRAWIRKEVREAHRARNSKRFTRMHKDGEIRYDTFTGRKHDEESKVAMRGPRPTFVGNKNSQYGTIWVCRPGDKPKKVKKTDFAHWFDQGWQRGRKIT